MTTYNPPKGVEFPPSPNFGKSAPTSGVWPVLDAPTIAPIGGLSLRDQFALAIAPAYVGAITSACMEGDVEMEKAAVGRNLWVYVDLILAARDGAVTVTAPEGAVRIEPQPRWVEEPEYNSLQYTWSARTPPVDKESWFTIYNVNRDLKPRKIAGVWYWVPEGEQNATG